MIRRLVVVLPILFAGTRPALAQIHPIHPTGLPHDSLHVRMDSATHAALHALMMGSWAGTATDPHGKATPMVMSLADDSLHRMHLTMHGAHLMHGPTATNLMLHGDTLRWTQDHAGKACDAMAVHVIKAGQPVQMNGKMVCGGDAIAFTFQKQKK